MKIKSILECERKNAKKFLNFQLPNAFKKIGWIVFLGSFVALIIVKFLVEEAEMATPLKSIAKYAILIGLLIISLSKEVVEDEYIRSLRMQSYMFSFLIGVLYALVMPFINFGVEALIDGSSTIEDVGDFVILWMLLCIQIFYFTVLKKSSND